MMHHMKEPRKKMERKLNTLLLFHTSAPNEELEERVGSPQEGATPILSESTETQRAEHQGTKDRKAATSVGVEDAKIGMKKRPCSSNVRWNAMEVLGLVI